MCVCMLSSVRLSVIPWTVAHQASLSVGFPRQEYWSGVPFPTVGDLPDWTIKPSLLYWQANSLPAWAIEEAHIYIYLLFFGFPYHLHHHRALSRVPWAIQYVLISYLLYPVLCLITQPCPALCDPMEPARFLCPWGFSRQEYWSGLPCPPLGDHSNPGIKPRSPTLQADSLPAELLGKPYLFYTQYQ